jgi:hypothetical protein
MSFSLKAHMKSKVVYETSGRKPSSPVRFETAQIHRFSRSAL